MTIQQRHEPGGFEIFPWNRNFETGLKDIDEQHKVLVDILNRLAWHFASDVSEMNARHLLDELLAYAAYHFQYEETVWKESLGESELSRNHHDAHQMFFVQVQMLRQSDAPQEEVLTELFDYLTRWLAFHILESDRRMALIVRALEAGASSVRDAKERVDSDLSGSVSVLISALLEIYGKLSASTIQLMREKMARQQAESELHRIQHERLHHALEQQASDYQRQLETLAYSDPLTGLSNRNGLIRAVRDFLEAGVRPERSAALVSIDLDNFQAVNRRHGEESGDRMLGLLSRRWLDALPSGAVLARVGGDEFAVFLPNAGQVESWLEALKLTARQPIDLDGGYVTTEFTAGIVLFPDEGSPEPDILLRQADNALFRAKTDLKGGWLYLDSGEQSLHRARQALLSEIRVALEEEQFRLFYQPKVNLHTGQVIGLEALIRWQHPDKGLLSPLQFLPAIEHHPLIISVGEWVLHEALRQMQQWDASGIQVNVGVNIAAMHLQSAGFPAALEKALLQFPDIDPGRLDLEILETAALGELEKAVEVIRDCQKLGVTFSLDDFGTGYSSLSYLKQLPVNTLKVDREFIREVESNRENYAILRGVIGLSRVFGKQLVAEGVETIEQGEILLRLGSQCAQGFGISPPIEPNKIPGWLSTWKPCPEWRKVPESDIQ